MPLSRLCCLSLVGLEAVPVDVEVDVVKSDGLSLIIVGLPDTAVRESKDRVLTAIKNSGFQLGTVHAIVNLAPSDLKKEGSIYDLPIALGLLRSAGLVSSSDTIQDYIIVGELALSGELRPICGALAIALLARAQGKKGILLPASNAKEAAAVPGIDIHPLQNLKEAVRFLKGTPCHPPIQSTLSDDLFKSAEASVDFRDVKGQLHSKRALEVAAAGSHNVVLSGPPGSGKTMLAKALIGIMPELTLEEAIEATKIHSVAGLLPPNQGLLTLRPFRSPHHTISYAGLIGGGSYPKPGEVSLAHQGILFLDELPEFSRSVLEVLRQPLEDRKVTISRANGNFTFPTSFVCIAAMNPCPCGYLGHPTKACKDSALQVDRYRGKISGPLWDRFDMHIDVPPLKHEDFSVEASAEPSSVIRERVKRARAIQNNRFGKVKSNAMMSSGEIKKYCSLDAKGKETLRMAVEVTGVSARAYDRILRVARTIADLDASDNIHKHHLMEALNLRNDRK